MPPLEGFVMNRVLGDYFETLLYKIFVSIDEHTTVAEVGSVSLQLLSRKTCIIMAKKQQQESFEFPASSERLDEDINKKIFQSKANHSFADRCMGYKLE